MIERTVSHMLEKHGPTMPLADVLGEFHISERTVRKYLQNGTLPKPAVKGRYPTEIVTRTFCGQPDEEADVRKGHQSGDEDDPFA